ncbi:MAG TPA: hypothetical protein G4N96_10360 [Chloroflexi bacterium]|nr:hypothetical protein [Chloroflexota bacterium]
MHKKHNFFFGNVKRAMLVLVILLFALANQIIAQEPNLIKNGGFEEGFDANTGAANEWGYFHSGSVDPGFYDDTWEMTVIEGDHSQLIELIDASELNTYAGIYQKVAVEPGQAYQLSFKGIVRSDEGSIEASDYGYRMQYAVDLSGNEDWQNVAEADWIELPWDEQPRTKPADNNAFRIESTEDTFTATGNEVTIFFRAWKKWVGSGEGSYNIDALRLVTVDEAAQSALEKPAQPLPETGQEQAASKMNTTILLISIVLILALIGGALFNRKYRTNSK